jgi:YD repeat-containing protein
MEGNQSRQRERCWVGLAALMIASSFAAEVRGQECDAGNPCEQSDSASQAAITPNTGANNPIDIVSGNKYQREVDFELPGELALSFVRHYNSSSVQGGAFGGGWSHGFETSLLREERKQADGSVTITLTIRQADGRHIVFTPFSSPDSSVTSYASAPFGYGVIEESASAIEALREASSDSESHTNGRGLTPWRWRWLDGKELIFDGTGTLKAIRSPSGESLDLQHDRYGRLVRVADHASRDLVLSYWDQPSDWLPSFDTDRGEVRGQRHRLKSVRLPSGESITYYYDANGLLARIAHADQTSKRYEYVESSGVLRLSRIVDREGRTEGTYGYDANGFANYSAQSHNADAVQVQRTEPTVKEGLGTSLLLTRDGARTTYSWRRSPHGIPLLVEAQGPGCQTCPRSNVRYTYTKDGLLQRIDDLASGTA